MFRQRGNIIRQHLSKKEATILIGARQVGKSTLLKQLAAELKDAGNDVVFLNLERKDILTDLNENPENIFRYFPQNSPKAYAFIDEVQYLTDPTNFLKLLYDEHGDKLKIVATGSSAFYIDRNFKDSLAGRKKIFELHTLSFEEFLQFRQRDDLYKEIIKARTNEGYVSVLNDLINVHFDEYLLYGGYPAVVLAASAKDKIEMLDEIKYSYIKRDISDSGVNDETKFYRLMMLLASQVGSLVNVNELSNTLSMTGITVDNYLYIMQKSFHINLAKPFHQNLRKELVKMPKVYFRDLGLRHSLLNNFNPITDRQDKGQVIENYIFKRLIEDYPADNVKFWRTADGNEVDFVVETEFEKGIAYEVKYSEKEFKESKYKKFKQAYPNYPLNCVGLVPKSKDAALWKF